MQRIIAVDVAWPLNLVVFQGKDVSHPFPEILAFHISLSHVSIELARSQAFFGYDQRK